MKKFFQRYLLSGLIFQSVVIAGGYATGRELVEFFLSHGPAAGLLGMLVTTLLVSAFLPVGFEFARVFRAYDYYSFVKQLLGRFWLLFELGYAAAVVLILAVIAAGVGTVASEKLGVPWMRRLASSARWRWRAPAMIDGARGWRLGT